MCNPSRALACTMSHSAESVAQVISARVRSRALTAVRRVGASVGNACGQFAAFDRVSHAATQPLAKEGQHRPAYRPAEAIVLALYLDLSPERAARVMRGSLATLRRHVAEAGQERSQASEAGSPMASVAARRPERAGLVFEIGL